MSFMVLHMDKFKKDAVRGIQSHNRRERESHSNPDIDYDRSAGNYDLCANPSSNYAEAIQNRIDELLMVKAVRKDAVHMCALIISSDRDFFDKLTPNETRRFFEEAANYLTEFVGRENVISAMVHMDEKTPHMHFLHVPVTKDGRLCAKDIYTKAALKRLQDDLPKHLQKCGFQIERGVERKKGSAKKHLDTIEYKQQQEMMASMREDADNLRTILLDLQKHIESAEARKAALDEEIDERKKSISEAMARLENGSKLPPANFFNYNDVLAYAQGKIDDYQKALSDRNEVSRERDEWEQRAKNLLHERNMAHEAIRNAQSVISALETDNKNLITQKKREQENAEAEITEMRDFIQLSGNHIRFQEFQLQRRAEKERETHEREQATLAAERERQIRQDAERQNQSRGMRLR